VCKRLKAERVADGEIRRGPSKMAEQNGRIQCLSGCRQGLRGRRRGGSWAKRPITIATLNIIAWPSASERVL
jgi:hypothetical protein